MTSPGDSVVAPVSASGAAGGNARAVDATSLARERTTPSATRYAECAGRSSVVDGWFWGKGGMKVLVSHVGSCGDEDRPSHSPPRADPDR